ncbi:hypothetical protein HDU96_006977 [Phlyctochytrium bullatum]|nr:hypothetical protein HDU96_006977 [Phlyctochytrium bullatum]
MRSLVFPLVSLLLLLVGEHIDAAIVPATLPSRFRGVQEGAIASWFRTNNAADSTNGNSWCAFPYSDDMIGFAPPLRGMTGGEDVWYQRNTDRWVSVGKEFCGLEAWVYSPQSGINVTMYVVDAFDQRWVLTPTSIDVTIKGFELLSGLGTPRDKNVVLSDVMWKFTGNRRTEYSFGAK